ncbi:MAG TPA: alpha-L-rhamnosidase C-terminal domain-containing protein [Ruminiclostridium sp.]|nr:alpha-L-rhamnosidase C-terminal domain-containing protein [Ruminiclostridium sp.]
MCILKKLNAEWIWLPQEKEIINQYVNFRHEFFIDSSVGNQGLLYISIDTEYAVWINGVFVNCGQYDDFPDHKSYDVLDIKKYLQAGRNVLCILGYHQGESSFQYIKGRPGLIYALKFGENEVVSGSDTFCRQDKAYRSGNIEKISPQLSFTFEYNAAKGDSWLSDCYAMDESWVKAQINKKSAESIALYERPIQKVDIGQAVESKIVAQGFFIRNYADQNVKNRELTTAERLQSDYLSSRSSGEVFAENYSGNLNFPSKGIRISKPQDGNDGVYILIDLNREEAGLFELELEGEEEVVIEESYGQHVDDLRVRAAVGGYNFANKYICRAGIQKFTHYIKRMSGRYIQLHISGIKKEITIYYAGIRPVQYPLSKKGVFTCNDRLLDKIYEVSVRTLELCMHEHYEDTPWREQGMYAMDSRNQALCGYYCFGEYDFAGSSFSLFKESLKEDGMLEICTPSEFRITIPSFSLAWIMAVADFVLYSGRVDTAEKLFPSVKFILDSFLKNMKDGLLRAPSGDRYWNFYDWAEGLDDSCMCEPDFKREALKRFDAPLNLFLCLALEAAVKISKWIKNDETEKYYVDSLARLRDEFHRAFWDDEKKAYKTYLGENYTDHYAELTQALALCSGTVPEKYRGLLREKLSDNSNSLVKTSISYSIFKYEALLQDAEKYGSFVFNEIAEDWGYMLYNKATSFWETIKGADDFDKAGSLCHGWSAVPVYFLSAYILGIKPLEPGFRKFVAKPLPNVVSSASGRVPTPYGDINVQWNKGNAEGYKVSFPGSITRV